jgi:hypothetical protein
MPPLAPLPRAPLPPLPARTGKPVLRRSAGAALLFLLVAAAGCETRERPADPPAAPRSADRPGSPVEAASLVDPTVPRAAEEPAAWGYRQAASADLNGDGNLETVVLVARVETIGPGRVAWDDGQPWQLYVEDADGNLTIVFSRYVQLGTLAMRVTLPETLGRPAIVLLEHMPDGMTLYEIDYLGPGAVEIRRLYQRALDPRGEIAAPVLP